MAGGLRDVDEEGLVKAGHGKWSEAGVPHRGWTCVDIEDLGAPDIQCEMCESKWIRYVHHMQHRDYSSTLAVGCVCAGNMEGDLFAARGRESSMQSRAGKRRRWLTRRWKVAASGNDYLVADGYRVVICSRRNGWGVTIAGVRTEFLKHSRLTYPTRDRAKLAGFDEITRLLLERN